MAAAIDTTRGFQAGIPQPLFSGRIRNEPAPGFQATTRRQYAVARDGKRFLTFTAQSPSTATPLTVVVNWLASVQK
jgi:hypothetical protein